MESPLREQIFDSLRKKEKKNMEHFEKESLKEYQNSEVMIWGCGQYAMEVFRFFQANTIEISFFCDNNPDLWGTEMEGVSVISPKELEARYFNSKKEVFIQLAMLPKNEEIVREQLEDRGILNLVSFLETMNIAVELETIEADEHFSIYREHPLVIWGCTQHAKILINFFQKLDIAILGICDGTDAYPETKYEKIPLISPLKLKELQKNQDVLVQMAVYPRFEYAEIKKVKELGISKIMKTIVLSQDQFFLSRDYFIEKYPQETKELSDFINSRKNLSLPPFIVPNPETDNHLLVIQPSKTGDCTIAHTYSEGKEIGVKHFGHQPNKFKKKWAEDKVVKITTAIREPISRDLSGLFHQIAFGTLCGQHYVTFDDCRNFYQNQDYQKLFEKAFDKDFDSPYYYTWFFDEFKKYIVDVTAYPFDQEKGYAIIKEGNIEVFAYQLEKLNHLVPELSQWMELPFTELVNENEASSRWVADSYSKAKKEIKFSQKYFDSRFQDPYVNYFYSQGDLEKMKNKWRTHIEPKK